MRKSRCYNIHKEKQFQSPFHFLISLFSWTPRYRLVNDTWALHFFTVEQESKTACACSQAVLFIFPFDFQIGTHQQTYSHGCTYDQNYDSSRWPPKPQKSGGPIPKRIECPHACIFGIILFHISDRSRGHCYTGPKPHRFFQPRRIYPDSQKQCCTAKYCCAPNNTADHHPIPFLVFILAQEALHCKISKKCVPQSDTHFYFLFTGNYTSSMIAISAASPRRAPVRVTLV